MICSAILRPRYASHGAVLAFIYAASGNYVCNPDFAQGPAAPAKALHPGGRGGSQRSCLLWVTSTTDCAIKH